MIKSSRGPKTIAFRLVHLQIGKIQKIMSSRCDFSSDMQKHCRHTSIVFQHFFCMIDCMSSLKNSYFQKEAALVWLQASTCWPQQALPAQPPDLRKPNLCSKHCHSYCRVSGSLHAKFCAGPVPEWWCRPHCSLLLLHSRRRDQWPLQHMHNIALQIMQVPPHSRLC